jgi:hypothetical protein
MRPVNKGEWPQENGANVDYTEYGEARPELINRIGDYCSYCENQITNPALEHEQPKSITPGIELNWYNFLLGCVSCNSRKGHHWLNVDDYYWPDVHNSHLLFDFFPLGIVAVKRILHHSVDRLRAERTFNLTGLGEYGHTTTLADRRWIKRCAAWGKADNFLQLYENHNKPPDFIQAIVNTATSTGFWSVWIRVFENHLEVQDGLIAGYNNTYTHCRERDINRL